MAPSNARSAFCRPNVFITDGDFNKLISITDINPNAIERDAAGHATAFLGRVELLCPAALQVWEDMEKHPRLPEDSPDPSQCPLSVNSPVPNSNNHQVVVIGSPDSSIEDVTDEWQTKLRMEKEQKVANAEFVSSQLATQLVEIKKEPATASKPSSKPAPALKPAPASKPSNVDESLSQSLDSLPPELKKQLFSNQAPAHTVATARSGANRLRHSKRDVKRSLN